MVATCTNPKVVHGQKVSEFEKLEELKMLQRECLAYLEWKKNVEGEAVEGKSTKGKGWDWLEEDVEEWLEEKEYEESLKESEKWEGRSHLLINFAVVFVCTDHCCMKVTIMVYYTELQCLCNMIKKTENPDQKSEWVKRRHHFKEQRREEVMNEPLEKRQRKMKRLVEFTINIKIKMSTSSFEALALLDSRAQDCSINKNFTKSTGLKLIELSEYLQWHTGNADNTLSEKKLKYKVHCIVEFQGHCEWLSLLVMSLLF